MASAVIYLAGATAYNFFKLNGKMTVLAKEKGWSDDLKRTRTAEKKLESFFDFAAIALAENLGFLAACRPAGNDWVLFPLIAGFFFTTAWFTLDFLPYIYSRLFQALQDIGGLYRNDPDHVGEGALRRLRLREQRGYATCFGLLQISSEAGIILICERTVVAIIIAYGLTVLFAVIFVGGLHLWLRRVRRKRELDEEERQRMEDSKQQEKLLAHLIAEQNMARIRSREEEEVEIHLGISTPEKGSPKDSDRLPLIDVT